MRTTPLWLSGLAAVVTLCAGCTEYVDGTPTAAPPDSSRDGSTTANSAMHGAPHVPNPLNATAFLDRPCAILTAGQLARMDLPSAGNTDTGSDIAELAGPSCTWYNEDKDLGTRITFLTANKNGLADTYRGHEQGQYPVWEPTTVAGYPAVLNGNIDLRAHGRCGVTVGISETLTIFADDSDSVDIGAKSCDRATQLAAMAIATLKAGN